MRSILTRLVLLSLIILPTLSIAQSTTKDLGNFDGVTASGNIELVLIADSKNYAEIEVKKTSLDKLEIEIKGSTLKLKLKNKGLFNLFGGSGKAYVKLHYTQDLEKIGSSAAADISSRDVIETTNLKLSSSSGSSIALEIECNEVDASVSSGADIELTGDFSFQDISVSSGGSYEAHRVESREVRAKASSGGHIKVWASDKLKGKASSGASIDYKGSPTKTEVSSSSGGSVGQIR